LIAALSRVTCAFSHTDSNTLALFSLVIKLKAKKQTPRGDKNHHNSRLMAEGVIYRYWIAQLTSDKSHFL
jgi:hypothetical protein